MKNTLRCLKTRISKEKLANRFGTIFLNRDHTRLTELNAVFVKSLYENCERIYG